MNSPVTYRTHSRSRRVNIRINQQGEIIVTYPKYVSRQTARHFLSQSQSWIDKQLDKINQTKHTYGLSVGKIMLLGDLYQTITILVKTNKQERLICRPFILELHTTKTNPIYQSTQLSAWMKQQAKLYFPPIVNHWSTHTGWQPKQVRITTMTSRWGSCSAASCLNLNSFLYQAPPSVIEYVILHELTHIAHPNHSPRFWHALARHCPDYQLHRKWLRLNNRQLLGWQKAKKI